MAKILMVIAPQGYQDKEFEIPRDTFINAGHTVTVASKDTETATGALGGSTNVDIDISKVNPEEYDAAVFIGGGGASVYFNEPAAHKIAQNIANAGKPTAAICIAPSTLANAGLLKGKKATAFPSEQGNLEDKGAQFTGTDVEVDGNIVTASGPPAAPVFAEKILGLLS